MTIDQAKNLQRQIQTFDSDLRTKVIQEDLENKAIQVTSFSIDKPTLIKLLSISEGLEVRIEGNYEGEAVFVIY